MSDFIHHRIGTMCISTSELMCAFRLSTLNQMAAHDELQDDQIKQLLMDLEVAYNGFHRALSQK